MSRDDMDEKFQRVAEPILSREGFRLVEPGGYRRDSSLGFDRIVFDPEIKKGRSSVLCSYYPVELESVAELMRRDPTEPRGFPCGPYLTPVLVGRRPYYWSLRNGQNAILQMAVAIEKVALLWLTSLRDPCVFASEVDPVAAIYAGAAFERAGLIAASRERYSEMFRRFQEMRKRASEEYFTNTFGRPFVFVAEKLGVELEFAAKCRRILRFDMTVLPLS
jgi:hypothetical protein